MITLAGKPLLSAAITLPGTENWSLEAVVSSDTELSGRVNLDENGNVFSGTVKSGAVLSGRWSGRIVGGNGGLDAERVPRAYQNTTLGVVLSDILTEANEKQAGDSDPTLLTRALPQWLKFGSAEEALRALVIDGARAVWRVKRDGTIWIGTDAFAATNAAFVLLEKREAQKHWVIAPESTALGPGVSLQGRRVVQVIHRLEPGSLRTEVHFE